MLSVPVLAASLVFLPLLLARRVWHALYMWRRKVPPEIYYPAQPKKLLVKPRAARRSGEQGSPVQDGAPERMSINTFLETHVPSLFEGYRPCWWLPNGHFQTIYMSLKDFTKVDQVIYERTVLRLPDGGTLSLDITPPPSTPAARALAPDAPVIVVQHGLTGGSYEPYVRSILAGACREKAKGGLGFRAVVINFRGCAGTPITSPQWYSAGHTEDLRSGVLFIADKWPTAPLVGLGFSLGANILTRYIGEEGPECRLRAGVVLGCPWDTKINSYRLQDEWFTREVYGRALGANVLAMFHRHLEEVKALPKDKRLTPQIPIILGLKKPTLLEIDTNLTRVFGGSNPPFPFKTVDDYLEWSQSFQALRTIRVPFLALNAEDDPVVGYNPTSEAQHSSTCALAITRRGGHLGWFHDAVNPFSSTPPDRWVRIPVLEFLRAAAEDYIPDPGLGPPSRDEAIVERDGWVLARGRDNVGYKIVGEGELIYGATHASTTRSGALAAGL